MYDRTEEALARPVKTVEAARVLREQAGAIEQAALAAGAVEIVVAVVRKDLSFAGVWTLARSNLASQVRELENAGGWSLTFAPGSTRVQIEARCDELAGLAQRRADALQQRVQRRSFEGPE